MILLVAYELKQSTESYAKLFEVLKNKNSWAHYMSSLWFIATQESAKELGQQLLPLIFQGDRILVTEVSSERWGWLPQKAWDWLNRYEDE